MKRPFGLSVKLDGRSAAIRLPKFQAFDAGNLAISRLPGGDAQIRKEKVPSLFQSAAVHPQANDLLGSGYGSDRPSNTFIQ
jgi:hypothetical protein